MGLKFSLFADLHYKKGGYIITAADMEAILDKAAANDAEFMIHCGDLCNDYISSPEMLKLAYENKYGLPLYGVYGNHELECEPNSMAIVTPNLVNRPVVWGTEDGSIGDGYIAYYYFDVRGCRFVCTDTNYSLTPDGRWEHNPDPSFCPRRENTEWNALGPEQLCWLEKTLEDAAGKGLHCIVISHASFSPGWTPSSADAEKVRAIFTRINEKKRGTVIFAINGHLHADRYCTENGILYLDTNTVRNSVWRPTPVEHYTDETFCYTEYDSSGDPLFSEERPVSSLRAAKNTWFSADPLSTIVTVEDDGTITIDSMQSDWLGGKAALDNHFGEHPWITGGTFRVDMG